jgi:hypothetical protein
MNEINGKVNWNFIDINEGVNPMQKSIESLFNEKFHEKVLKYGSFLDIGKIKNYENKIFQETSSFLKKIAILF